jgi:hypothetical protein
MHNDQLSGPNVIIDSNAVFRLAVRQIQLGFISKAIITSAVAPNDTTPPLWRYDLGRPDSVCKLREAP